MAHRGIVKSLTTENVLRLERGGIRLALDPDEALGVGGDNVGLHLDGGPGSRGEVKTRWASTIAASGSLPVHCGKLYGACSSPPAPVGFQMLAG